MTRAVIPETFRNQVLRDLARADRVAFGQIAAELDPLPLERGATLRPARSASDFVYFVESGVVSLVAATSNGNSIEVAVVGREGVAGVADALGDQPLSYHIMVQLPGLAYRARRDLIRQHILTCSALHGLLMRCSQALVRQLAQSAVCARFHGSVQRLARWLLMTAERAGTSRFELTHESVAAMVGAPRSAVSEAAAALRQDGLIDYRRGVLTIRDPHRLEQAACECFRVVTQPLDSVSAPAPPRGPGRRRTRRARR